MNYGEKQKLAEINKDVPTEVIQQDIADTQSEITQMEREAEYYEKSPLSLPTARLDHMKAEAKRAGIKERKEFIEKLEAILEIRASQKQP